MRPRLLGIIILFVSVLSGKLSAQTSPVGATAFPILSVGLGARAVGMGESFTAVSDDLSALQYNAAGLALIQNPQLSLNHNSYLDSGFFDTAGFAVPFGPAGTLAFGLNYLNYGSIDQRDASGSRLGAYTPFDIDIRGAYGFALDKDLFLGFSSQWIRQDINGVVHTGLLWDTGILAEALPGFFLGAALKNLGVDSGGYNLPTGFGVGASYRFSLAPENAHSLLLALDGEASFQGVSRINLGFEYALHQNYFLRCGYSQGLDQSQEDSVKGLDLGAGVKAGQFQFDYSFSFLGDLGNVHRFSLSIFLPGNEKSAQGGSSAKNETEAAGINALFLPPVNQPSKPVHLKFEVRSEEGQTAEQYFDRAEEKLRLGFKQEALDLYLKAVDKDPDFKKAWMSLGKLYFDRSLESYRKVLEMDPRNEKLRIWLDHFKQQ